MSPEQKTSLLVLVMMMGFGALVLAVLWSVQSKAERLFDEWVSRNGYRVVRRRWAVTFSDRGPFRWTTPSTSPVMDVVVDDFDGVRRECWVALDVQTSDSQSRVVVVWKDERPGGDRAGSH